MKWKDPTFHHSMEVHRYDTDEAKRKWAVFLKVLVKTYPLMFVIGTLSVTDHPLRMWGDFVIVLAQGTLIIGQKICILL